MASEVKRIIVAKKLKQVVDSLFDSDPASNIIIMGDFNSDWFADEEVIRSLADRTGLHVYQPEAGNFSTYRSSARRFDWILISRQLEFVSFEVMPDILSDHFAVVAEIAMKPPGEAGGAL